MDTTKRDGWGNLTFGSDDQEASDKLRELVLYIAHKCEDDSTFGAVKLNKILFYADFLSFARYEEPITGVVYRKLPQGPVPTVLKRIRGEMEYNGDIVVREREYYRRIQHRVIPLSLPDFSKLGGRDIALVDEIIEAFSDRNAKEVSELSHDRAWKAASDGEPIPYEAVFVSDEPLTERDIDVARDLIAEYEQAG